MSDLSYSRLEGAALPAEPPGTPPVEAPPALPPLLDHVTARLRRRPRQARSRAKVAALLTAAERLFGEQGYATVTADAIAAAAGVSTGTFYSYFGDKRDALLVLLAEHVDALMGVALPDPVAFDSPRALIAAAVSAALARGAAPRMLWLRCTWFEAARRDPELAAYERQVALRVTARLRAGLDVLVAAGLAREPLDTEATAWAVWTLVDALCVRLTVLGGAMPPTERLAAAATELICRAILTDEAGTEPPAAPVDAAPPLDATSP